MRCATRAKEPRVDFCRWHDGLIGFPGNRAEFPASIRNIRSSIICSGRLHQPRKSLVFTEDNYFDFLIGMKKNRGFYSCGGQAGARGYRPSSFWVSSSSTTGTSG